jgi:hypothetical protein
MNPYGRNPRLTIVIISIAFPLEVVAQIAVSFWEAVKETTCAYLSEIKRLNQLTK